MQFPRWAPIVQAQLYTFISRNLYIDLKFCQKSPIGGKNVHVYKTCPHLHKTIGSQDLVARVSIGLSAPDLNFVGWPLIPSLVLFRSLSMWTAEQASFASQFVVFQFFLQNEVIHVNVSSVSRRFVRKTFCQDRFVRHFFQADRLTRFVRKTFCQDRLTGGHFLGISWAYLWHISSISWAYLVHILGIS